MVIRSRRIISPEEPMAIYKWLSENCKDNHIVATTRSGKKTYQDVIVNSEIAYRVYIFLTNNWKKKKLKVTIKMN